MSSSATASRTRSPRTLAHRVRSMAAGFALACTSFAVALLLCEGLIRLLAPQQLVEVRPDIWMPVDTLGWVHRPNLNTTINMGEKTVRVITDAEGNRVGADGRRAAAHNILVLGDSYMAALQVEYEESIPGLLEEGLASHGLPASIRDTGVGAWEPAQYLFRSRQALERERFDLMLVFVYLGNDIVRERRGPYPPREPVPTRHVRLPRAASKAEIIDALLYPINDRLEAHSHLFVFFKQRAKVLLMRAGLTAREDPVELRVSGAEGPQWGITADILAEIAREGARHGTPALFIFLPASYQVDSLEFADYVRGFELEDGTLDIDQPNRLLLREMTQRGLEVIDPTSALRKAHTAGVRMHGRVDPHFSAEGHRLVAELLEPVVLERLQGSNQRAGIARSARR